MTNGISGDVNKPIEYISESPAAGSPDEFHLSLMQHVTDKQQKVCRFTTEH